jgi:hypothetical protein
LKLIEDTKGCLVKRYKHWKGFEKLEFDLTFNDEVDDFFIPIDIS